MKSFKKSGALALALAMVSSIMAGCNGGSTGPSANGEPVVINAWTSSAHSEAGVQEFVKKMNDTVFKEKGLQVVYKAYGNDYGKTVDMAIANDQAPELFSGSVATYANKKQIYAIDALPGGQEILDMYPESVEAATPVWVAGEDKAKIYTLPCSLVTYGLVYNKDLFKKAGIVDEKGEAKAPETWDEVRDAAKKITNPDEQTYGIIYPFKWSAYATTELIGPFGPSLEKGSFDHATGKYDYSVYKPILEWWLQIRDDKTVYPGPEGIDNDPARAKFSEGKVGMKIAASYDVAVFNDLFPAECDWDVAPYPVFDKNAPKYVQSIAANSFVSASTATPQEKLPYVVEALKVLYSEDLQQLLYEQGKNIPVAKAAVENAKNVVDAKGWKAFTDLLSISKKGAGTPSLKMEGDNEQAIYLKVWSGQMTIDQALADLTTRANAAYEKGVASGEIHPEMYYIENYKKTVQ